MSGTGVNYRDLIPLPEKTNAVNDPDKHEKAFPLADGPTASHALATADQTKEEEIGLVQETYAEGTEVRDLGWNEIKEHIPARLVGGMDNEELWLLIRRFNKRMYHVKETTKPVPGNLDINIADEDEFSPDKLRSTVERLYMTVIIGLLSFVKQIARLRSWRETRRTAVFCSVYFLAWLFDLLVPTISLFLIALIAFPQVRKSAFPPAPIALVDAKSGGLQKPKAGVLGSTDSATGAPENYKGEAVEAEAQNFVNGFAHIALSSVAGKHPPDEQDEETKGAAQQTVPDPSATALGVAEARVSASGRNPKHDKVVQSKPDVATNGEADSQQTKVPMETAMWNKMRPAMHALQDISDTWERFANALSPVAPFPREGPRLRLAALVVPLFATSILVTSYMFIKAMTFGVGFGFFGDPIIMPAIDWLNTSFPNWQKLLELRNTVLKGIPTNAQLTLTLLRLGEANKAPLPPPPYVDAPPPHEAAHLDEKHLSSIEGDTALGASHAELQEAIHADDGSTAATTHTKDVAAAHGKEHGKRGARVLGFLKSSIKGTVETAIGADHLKARTGNTAAKNRLGVVSRDLLSQISGPVDFRGRYHGKRGHVYISTRATIPCVAFSTDSNIAKVGSLERTNEQLSPVWSVAIADIRELRKVGGFGWKAKLIVGWALDADVADGIEIIDREGSTWKVTAMPLRDELFNRLIAMGGQKWEAW